MKRKERGGVQCYLEAAGAGTDRDLWVGAPPGRRLVDQQGHTAQAVDIIAEAGTTASCQV